MDLGEVTGLGRAWRWRAGIRHCKRNEFRYPDGNLVRFGKTRDGGDRVVVASGPGRGHHVEAVDAPERATPLDAAAAAFVESGVNVPVREIAARASASARSTGTSRREPTADRRRLPAPGRGSRREPVPAGAGRYAQRRASRWIGMFVDFPVTKYGLAEGRRTDDERPSKSPVRRPSTDRSVPVASNSLTLLRRPARFCLGLDAMTSCLAALGISASAGSDPRATSSPGRTLIAGDRRID